MEKFQGTGSMISRIADFTETFSNQKHQYRTHLLALPLFDVGNNLLQQRIGALKRSIKNLFEDFKLLCYGLLDMLHFYKIHF